MQKTFQKWLFLCIALAFLVVFSLSYFFQTRQARNNAISLMKMKIRDTKEQIQVNDANMLCVREMVTRASLAKARAFAEIVRLDAAMLTEQKRMTEVAGILDVDELYIIDDKGIIVRGTNTEMLGYDMASEPQSAEFMPAIGNPSFTCLQKLRPRGIDGKMFEYAGISRTDKTGIIQIGYQPHRLLKSIQITDIKNLSGGFRIGKHGKIIICQKDKIVSIDDENWLGKPISEYGVPEEKLIGESGEFVCNLKDAASSAHDADGELAQIRSRSYSGQTLCMFERFDDYIIIGMLPKTEMYLNRDSAMIEIIFFDFILFCLVFALVSWLVQRVVITPQCRRPARSAAISSILC